MAKAQAGATAGVVGMAEVNAAPSAGGPTTQIDVSKPAFWSVFWFVISVCWLLYVFGRKR